ncbi:hypothetical protein V1517DRAFT_170040 [Lipomyces orientalis]|uniref:Uncharacterized protein n=1 Tax=Lipomyces orientalis TaxID=1233043 RepID=A0ACC3TKZ3_9ASCO
MPLLRHAADDPANFTNELARQVSFDGIDEVSAAVTSNISFELAGGSHLSALADFRICWDQFETTSHSFHWDCRAGNIQSSSLLSLISTRVLNDVQTRTRCKSWKG